METMLCSVTGIDNKEDKTEIKNALKKIEGVGQVGVNLVSGTVKINYNARRRKTPSKTGSKNRDLRCI
jgi:copper chaperone CopZ